MVPPSSLQLVTPVFHEMPEVTFLLVLSFVLLPMRLVMNNLLATGNY